MGWRRRPIPTAPRSASGWSRAKAAAGGVRRAASPSAGDEEDFWRPGAAEEEAAAPDPEEAERYKGLALDAEGRYQGLRQRAPGVG